jgi:HSP20 family protein
MGFFEKLQLKMAEEPLQKPASEADGASVVSQKRKRGRPRKYPPKEQSIQEAEKMPAEIKQAKEISAEGEPEGELTIDVYETDEELVIRSPVAGVKPEDLDVSFEDDMLVIRGKREMPNGEEKRTIILQECYWGPFSRRLVLPVEVDGAKITASLERGLLTVRIPKIEGLRKKKIAIEEIEA